MRNFIWQTGRSAIKRASHDFTPRPSYRSYAAAAVPSRTHHGIQHILGDNASPLALRDACRCAKCVDQSTMQRDFLFSDIPPNIQASLQPDAEGSWKVRWTNDIPGFDDDHVSTFTAADIKRLKALPRSDYRPTTMLWDRDTYAREIQPVRYEEFMNDDGGLAKVLHQFRRHGLVFVTGVPSVPESVSVLATRIAPLRNTFYGNTWDVRSVPQAKNVAYTSKYLGFHMDLLYMRESPTAQFLHCLENTSTGGESRFVDTLKAYDTLCSEAPEHARTLRETRIRYEYDNDGQYYTDIKPVVESRHMKDLPRRTIAGAVNPESVEEVSRIYWSPPFIGSIRAQSHEPAATTAQTIEASRALADIFERANLVYETKMEAGTCVIFDNLRVLHARNAFDMNSGSRWLRGCYLDGQDVISRELALQDTILELDAGS